MKIYSPVSFIVAVGYFKVVIPTKFLKLTYFNLAT